MKKTVTLKEMVGTKIVYAVLLACYYWMWARRDWQDFYTTVQHGIVVFTILFFALQAGRIYQYGKGEKDQQGLQALRRADAILMKILAAANVVIAFVCAVTGADGRAAGYALVGTIVVLTVLRLILLCVLEHKEA